MRAFTTGLFLALSLSLSLSLSIVAFADEVPVFRDASKPVDARVADLLSRMTLEEKVAQLQSLWRDKNQLLDDEG